MNEMTHEWLERILKERDEALVLVAELEAKHPEWMKRIQRERLEERERIISVLLSTADPNKFRDYIDNDLCGIPCWDEEKLRAALNP